MGISLGGLIGDHFAGYLHLGRGTGGHDVHGGLLYFDRDRHHRGYGGHHYYPFDHYYHDYYPIHYGYPLYAVPYGYTYTSVYYTDPYAYRYYDRDVNYVDRYDDLDRGYDGQAVEEGPPPPDQAARRVMQDLTAVGDDTLVGQGNAAFVGGRYAEARRLYISAVLLDERDGHAKLLYAFANFAVGDHSVAGVALRRALLTTSSLIEYPPDVRLLYPNHSIFESHLDGLARSVASQQDNYPAKLLLGYLYFASGDAALAAGVFSELVKKDPDDNVVSLLRDAATRLRDTEGAGNG